MTKDEVLAMEAGTALNILVAEEILPGTISEQDGKTFYSGSLGVPLYSADLSAAWRVLEKLEWHEFNIHNEYRSNESGMECYWYCGIEQPEDLGERYFSATEKTLATAICKAALLSKLEVKHGV